jgi:hypothetical protein
MWSHGVASDLVLLAKWPCLYWLEDNIPVGLMVSVSGVPLSDSYHHNSDSYHHNSGSCHHNSLTVT